MAARFWELCWRNQMEVELRSNGRLEFILSKPKNAVESAAMQIVHSALVSGQKVTVETMDSQHPESGMSISVEV